MEPLYFRFLILLCLLCGGRTSALLRSGQIENKNRSENVYGAESGHIQQRELFSWNNLFFHVPGPPPSHSSSGSGSSTSSSGGGGGSGSSSSKNGSDGGSNGFWTSWWRGWWGGGGSGHSGQTSENGEGDYYTASSGAGDYDNGSIEGSNGGSTTGSESDENTSRDQKVSAPAEFVTSAKIISLTMGLSLLALVAAWAISVMFLRQTNEPQGVMAAKEIMLSGEEETSDIKGPVALRFSAVSKGREDLESLTMKNKSTKFESNSKQETGSIFASVMQRFSVATKVHGKPELPDAESNSPEAKWNSQAESGSTSSIQGSVARRFSAVSKGRVDPESLNPNKSPKFIRTDESYPSSREDDHLPRSDFVELEDE
ncbi:hypothetical protein ACA910_002551 [Epithemia clementina (nom. ined.)]